MRAFTAMRDKTFEYRRRIRRRPKLVALTLRADERDVEEERPELAVSESSFAIVELRDLIASIAGDDAMRFMLLKLWRATERDIAVLLGWPQDRATAARVQLGRKKGEIRRAIREFYGSSDEKEMLW